MNFLGVVCSTTPAGLDQEDKRSGTAIHDRNLRGGKFHIGIVNTQAGQCRHQVFYRGDGSLTIPERSREARISYIFRPGGDFNDRIEINPAKI